jgi:hypothetical protein
MSFFVRARFDVHDGRRAEFEKVALALRAQAEDEPGTLTYRFFLADDGGYLVLAAVAHNERAADLLPRVHECATLAFIEFYGPVGPELRDLAPNAPVFADVRGVSG